MKHKVDLSALEGLEADGVITLDEPASTWHLHEAPEWETQNQVEFLTPWAMGECYRYGVILDWLEDVRR